MPLSLTSPSSCRKRSAASLDSTSTGAMAFSTATWWCIDFFFGSYLHQRAGQPEEVMQRPTREMMQPLYNALPCIALMHVLPDAARPKR